MKENFPDHKLYGDELTIPSIFYEDKKEHLSINLSTGLWQDFKSGHKGNFPMFVAYHTGLPAKFVLEKFKASEYTDPKKLRQNLLSTFNKEVKQSDSFPVSIHDEVKRFTPVDYNKVFSCGYTYKDTIMSKAATHLSLRGLRGIEAYVDLDGVYAGRVIIPFRDGGELVYFVARTVTNQKAKYFNPKTSSSGLKSSDILYPYDRRSKFVIVTEGVMDAITLKLHYNLPATSTQGTNISERQARLLGIHDSIVLAYDNDAAGRKGAISAYTQLIRCGYEGKVFTCFPPSEYKDWNEVHIGKRNLRPDLAECTKLFDYKRRVIEQLYGT